MNNLLIAKPLRFFFFVTSLVIWLGVYLTGFQTVHWVSYISAVFFMFAAITGICPGIVFSKKLFKDNS